MPDGNRALLEMGATGLPYPFQFKPTELKSWLEVKSAQVKIEIPKPVQVDVKPEQSSLFQ